MQGRAYAALRKQKRLTQAALAAELGVTPQMVSAIERGERPVPGDYEPWEEPDRKLDRVDYDTELALGSTEDDLVYVLARVEPRSGRLELPASPHAFEEPAQAEAALPGSPPRTVVVPVWRSFLNEERA